MKNSRVGPATSAAVSSVEESKNTGLQRATPPQGQRATPPQGPLLSFHSVYYTIQVSDPKKRCGLMPKEILQNVNGLFKPGMNAILGPTGGGKTSLLDILAGRKNPDGLSGEVLIDGSPQPKNFKCMAGYVVQDDVVMGTLTVRENFMLSANLRLSNKQFSKKQKEYLVQETLEELGLTKCADSKVGTEFIRGVSGGERKRTNIGMELIISPRLLFLDEPTTGLDASTANAVMTLLHELSAKGRTIIFSIHQPSYAIFKQFDRLMLLAGGRTGYHGPANQALSFFESLGHQCEVHNNPPDFFLDVINGDSTAVRHLKLAKHAQMESGDGVGVVLVTGEPITKSAVTDIDKSISQSICDNYAESEWMKEVNNQLDLIWRGYLSNKGDQSRIEVDYATSFLTQLYYLSKRAVINLFRNPEATILQFVFVIFFAALIGLIYLQLDLQYPSGIQNRVGALFFIVMNQVFANLSAVELFIKERKIFIHESSSGFYRVSAYFFAKLFCDVIPMRFIPLTCFTIITYFMIGFQMNVSKFFIFYLNLFVTSMAASGVGFLVSASFGVFAVANISVATIYRLMMVFGGLFVNLSTMAAWISWLQYLSILHYGYTAMCINELYNQNYYIVLPYNETHIPYPDAGNNYLTEQGIAYGTAWDLWQNIMANAIIAIGLMFFTYVQLRRIKKVT